MLRAQWCSMTNSSPLPQTVEFTSFTFSAVAFRCLLVRMCVCISAGGITDQVVLLLLLNFQAGLTSMQGFFGG